MILTKWSKETIINTAVIKKNIITHQIVTKGLPVHTKIRILSNEKLIEAKNTFNELIEKI